MTAVSNILSTQEVAALMNVTETTVKRWADEGKIPCIKTPGGHRKFLMKDVIEFAEKNSYQMTGTLPPPMTKRQMEQLEFAVHTKNFPKVSEIFFEEALQADREGLYSLLMYLYRHHIAFSTIADEVMRPALVRIGDLWESGKIEVNQEHRASQATMESMIRLAPDLHRKTSNELSAVCACPEDEFHELGLRSLAYALESEGWQVHYVGANTPFDTLSIFLKALRPDLVCLSFTVSPHRRKLFEEIRSLGKLVHSVQSKFLVGGFGVDSYRESEFNCDHVSLSVQDAVSYTRDVFGLKPGPKRTKASTERVRAS